MILKDADIVDYYVIFMLSRNIKGADVLPESDFQNILKKIGFPEEINKGA